MNSNAKSVYARGGKKLICYEKGQKYCLGTKGQNQKGLCWIKNLNETGWVTRGILSLSQWQLQGKHRSTEEWGTD